MIHESNAETATPDVAGVRPRTSRGRVGQIIDGKWRIERVISGGAAASVYAATHVRNAGRAAIKILDGTWEAGRARFLREGMIANAVGHAGAVKVLDDGFTAEGAPFLVMELLEGATLEQIRRERGGIVPVAEVVRWACEILDVLVAAHARTIIHRDLKPSNVLVTKDGRVKVLDFGTAFLCNAAQWSGVTGIGAVVGTPAYMPPEQALGKRADVDARSDLWALGATLHVLLSGQPVHDRESPRAQMFASATMPARPLREIAPHVPRAVASVVDRALAFDKSDRWEDAGSMREALRWSMLSLSRIPAAAPATPRALLLGDAPTQQEPMLLLTKKPALIGESPLEAPPPLDTLRPISHEAQAPMTRRPSPVVTFAALATITAGALAIFAFVVAAGDARPHVAAAAAPPPLTSSFEPGPMLDIGSLAAPAPAVDVPPARGGALRPPRWLAKYMGHDDVSRPISTSAVVHPDEQADPPEDDGAL